MERPGQISFPNRVIGYADIAKGVAEIVVHEAKMLLHFVGDSVRHEGISDHHFEKPAQVIPFPDHAEPLPTIPDFEHRAKGW